MKKKIRNDILFGAAALLIAAVAFLWPVLFSHTGTYVSVQRDGLEIARYSLLTDGEYFLTEGDSENTLVISGGKASVTQASCPDKICVRHSAISRKGETIVCLPNRLVIEIIGGSDSGLDARA